MNNKVFFAKRNAALKTKPKDELMETWEQVCRAILLVCLIAMLIMLFNSCLPQRSDYPNHDSRFFYKY